MAIPSKRHHRTDVTYLTPPEVTALLAAPDQTTPAGRRDHALIQLAVTAGLRISELTGLNRNNLHLGPAAHIVCSGKGRKNRVTPLDRETVDVLRGFTATLPAHTDVLFPTRTGTRMSRDAVAKRLTQHSITASTTCSTLAGKRITPHVLRHYVDAWVMAGGRVSRLRACHAGRFRPHNPAGVLSAGVVEPLEEVLVCCPVGKGQLGG
jgi:integrase/recombinase XerD